MTDSMPPADQTPPGEYYELSTHLIALEVMRRGYQPRWLRSALFVVEIDGVMHGWNMTRCNATSTIALQITGSKRYTRRLLRDAALSIARGGSCRTYDQALNLAEQVGWPVVVKPAGQGSGRGVTVGVRNEDELREASNAADSPDIIIEHQVDGEEARLLVVGGRCIAVCGQRRPNVVGDGASTIAELVAAKQARREVNPHLRGKMLELTDARSSYLLGRGLTHDSIPPAGETVWLEERGGLAGRPSIWRAGADSVDLTDTVHPSYLRVAERAHRAIPGLGLSGVDIIAHDWSQPAEPGNHVIIEVNSRPAIGAHHYPWQGEPRDAAGAIVDYVLGGVTPAGRDEIVCGCGDLVDEDDDSHVCDDDYDSVLV